jgi:hypothetical protein
MTAYPNNITIHQHAQANPATTDNPLLVLAYWNQYKYTL